MEARGGCTAETALIKPLCQRALFADALALSNRFLATAHLSDQARGAVLGWKSWIHLNLANVSLSLESALLAVDLAPDRLEGWRSLAFVSRLLFDEHYSELAFERAMQIDPSDTFSLLTRSNFLHFLCRREEANVLSRIAYEQSDECHMSAFTTDTLCWTLCNLSMFDEAIARCDQLLVDHPREPWLHYNKATSYAGLKQVDLAIASFDHCLQLNDNFTQARSWKISMLLGDQRVDEARDLAQEQAQKATDDPTVMYDRANFENYYMQAIARDEHAALVLHFIQRAIDLSPTSLILCVEKFSLMRVFGQLDAAIDGMRRLFASRYETLSPLMKVIINQAMFDLHAQQNNLIDARVLTVQSLRVKPYCTRVLLMHARLIRYEHRDRSLVVDQLNKAFRLNPFDLRINLKLARNLMRCGRLVEALKHAKIAQSIEFDFITQDLINQIRYLIVEQAERLRRIC